MAKKIRDEDLVLNIIVNGDQGKKEIGQLERALRDTRKEMQALEAEEQKLRKEGKQNTAQYKAVTAAIREKSKAMDVANTRLKQLRQGMELNKMSVKDLRREMTRLRGLRDIATPHTAEWKKHEAQLQKVQARYRQLTTQAKATGNVITRMASGINRMFGAITAGIATFTAAAFGVRKATDTFVSFDDKIADVQKTTGTAKEEVLELNEALKDTEIIDTRTTQEGLLGLGRIAGKLGIEGRDNLLGFIKAADEISVALTEDLGGDIEQSINTIGKIVDVFDVDQEFGIETALRKTGSLINELGASSSASEEEIVDFMSRLAGIGPSAGISIQNIAGLGSTLSQLKQSMEVAGTTLVNVIPKMFTNTARFAEIAGMGVEEFTELLNTNANEALIRFLEGLRGNNEGMAYMMKLLQSLKLEGARAKNILSVLANNTDKLRKEQVLSNEAFVEGTSITEEFNVKNTNAAAELEKSRKAVYNMWVELGERLYPVMIESNKLFAVFLGLITNLIDFIRTYWREIVSVTAAIVFYNVALAVSNFNLKENIILTKAKVLWDQAQRGALLLAAAAQALYTGNVARSTAAMRVFNRVIMRNPLLLLLSLLAGVITYLVMYKKELTAAEEAKQALVDINKKANEAVADEKSKVQQLLRVARNRELSDETRIKAIKELNQLSPEYLGNLTLETINTQEATKASEAYIKSLVRQAKAEALLNALREIESERIKNTLTGEGSELSWWQSAQSGFLNFLGFQRQAFDLAVENSEKNQEAFNNALDTRQKALQEMYDDLLKENEKANAALDQDAAGSTTGKKKQLTEEETEALKKAAEEREKYRREILESQRSLIEAENASYEERLKNAGIFNKKFEDMTLEDHQIEWALLKQHEANIAKIEADAISAEISRREAAFQKELTELHIRQNLELQVVKNNQEAWEKLTRKHQEEEERLTREYADRLITILQDAMQSGEWEGITADKILSDEEKAVLESKIQDLRLLLSELGLKTPEKPESEENRDIFGMTPEDWENFGSNLEATKRGVEGITKLANGLADVWGQYNEFVKAGEEKQLQQFESNTERKKAALKSQLDAGQISQEQYNKAVEKLDAELDRKKAEFAYNQAKRDKSVAIFSAIVNTASAVVEALPNVALAILAGALGAVQIGTIAKTPLPEIPGREDGGYLDVRRSKDRRLFRAKSQPDRRGYVDRPTIIAGENGREFVASNEAFHNPTIRPVLDAIDTAQRNGTISTVNLMKVFKERPISLAGRQQGGYINPEISSSSAESDSNKSASDFEMKSLLRESIETNRALRNEIRRGIKVSLLGKNGFYEAEEDYNQIQNNVNL